MFLIKYELLLFLFGFWCLLDELLNYFIVC
jgi:hypothetical protein